jgi:hypothetical protein
MPPLAEIFANPPVKYRPVPQWSWNGDLSRERITEQLEQFAAQGCGGVFAHARSGHITGYLTERWFELWEFARQEAERLGLQFHIYDEFTCPAGVAGGNVIAEDPSLLQHELSLVPAADTKGEVLLRLRMQAQNVEIVAEQADATHALVLVPTGRGALAAPDLLHPETARLFLRLTHERYKQHSGAAFGRNVIFMFSDEPMLLTSGQGFPFSRYLQKEFFREHGYALEGERLLSLCFPRPDSAEVRFRFWRTVSRLFNENFMKPLYDWCERNRLLFTGHLMEHEWPVPTSTPDNMANLRWMHAPGEDLLGFQFAPTRLAENGLYLLNLKELSSLASQLQRKWRMVETCGGRGFHTAYAYFKPCEDFTLSFGVNVIDPHLAHQTLAGNGKYDWPQTLTDHSPWWKYYRQHAQHVARVNAALSQGEEHNRVLVLMPTTSAWMHYAGTVFDAANDNASKQKMEWFRQTQIDLIVALYESQVDFDLGDEFLLQEFGRVEKGKFAVGARAYAAVLVPAGMENVCESTLGLLRSWLKSSGNVYALAKPEFVDGQKSDSVAALAQESGWHALADLPALVAALRQQVPPYVTSPNDAPVPGGLVWRRVVTEQGVLWFFCNPWAEPLRASVRIEGASASRLDTARGTIAACPVERTGDHLCLALDLPPRGHELLLVTKTVVTVNAAPPKRQQQPVALRESGIKRIAPNLLYLDYCDLRAYGQERRDIVTALADTLNWRWQGFEGNPWHRQFRRTLIDRQPEPDSEFSVTYRFEVAKDASSATWASIRIALERPWLYQIEINGQRLDSQAGIRWFDEQMRAFEIGRFVHIGENTLTLNARPFRTLCEIMPVYLLGDFHAKPVERGFVIANQEPLRLGDWTAQGLPFYADRVRYQYGFSLSKQTDRLVVRVPEWEGSVAVVALDGSEIGAVMHPPYECSLGGASAGEHTLSVDVLGNMKNMMGSHHIVNLPLRWTFEYAPKPMPPGKEYRVSPTGLHRPPELLVE